ncbi:bifunctional glutamate--cysteine ligase GshA/glutathione synthetase GshB [Paenibacillus aceti]|uniref:Glutathione biosynthesis bifunctional protein GshAB n=1 Tax=Paenibacillus aceti TaxID=1820010 RepID=A0ABQ1VU83_9BACL|nr:bifunctional glutamate--cysteine ligase GshA/glutathione synthetase GshB [Paenibacillus aceti]GGF98825.1 glutathione biosynthesis bifunctional protein GshAB [Paenibacillus aceti]
MTLLDHQLIKRIMEHDLDDGLFRGRFGLEKENVRVDANGQLALTPHPKVFGNKLDNPYIQTDFSESQIEMITPPLNSTDEALHFLEALHNIVTEQLEDEYLWPSSNPPALPCDEEIPIARLGHPAEDIYREQLAEKYGRKKQLLSGIHFNFSFDERFLQQLYGKLESKPSFRGFKDELYFRVARNVMKYRWLLAYVVGASPVFDPSYVEKCVSASEQLADKSHFFPHMVSLRNSVCGYRNNKFFPVSLNSLEEYVHDLHTLVDSHELLSAKEFYSPVRIKSTAGGDLLQGLIEHGAAYLELRMIDLNPLQKAGICRQTLDFVHLFLIFMLLKIEEPFDAVEQEQAAMKVDRLMKAGIDSSIDPDGTGISFADEAMRLLNEMQEMVSILQPEDNRYMSLLEQEKCKVMNPELSDAAFIRAEVGKSSYVAYHLEMAKQYAVESKQRGYRFNGYEDLELSTQLLLKAAVKRGIAFEILDRDENFIALKKGNHIEYVKQSTKTSLDSYSSVLIMENKIVTKKVLKQHSIRVPEGEAYNDLQAALNDYEQYSEGPIVIKPKSTNFGLGITIFKNQFSREDYRQAFEMAFAYDSTVLLEPFMTGKEYRFLVMGDEVVGVLHRVPANVRGDGSHTIEQLVALKNQDPLRGKGYKTPLERIELGEAEVMFLKNQGKSIHDIPDEEMIVYLRENSNISTGGDSIDFTDEIPDSYKRIAVRSAQAAGAVICGVDMMIDNIHEEASAQNYSIIEINFNPAIHIHCYPYQGKNRRADDKILDLLFRDAK